jgi:hypothetical protein
MRDKAANFAPNYSPVPAIFPGVLLGLPYTFRERQIPFLRLDHSEFGVPIDEDVVRDLRLATLSSSLEPPISDLAVSLPEDTASIDVAPACILEDGGRSIRRGFRIRS